MVDTEQGRLTMNQPQQHYDVTDDDFDFIWKNIDFPLVVRDWINVIKTRSHPYQSERNKVLDEVIEFLKSKQNISPFTELYYHAAIEEIDKELRQAGEP